MMTVMQQALTAAPTLLSADFDGSRLGTVELSDGSRIDVLVDVDPSPRGYTTFDAYDQHDAAAVSWVRANSEALENAWAERGAL